VGTLDRPGEEESRWRRFRGNLSIGLVGGGLTLAIKLGQVALLTNALRIDDYGRVLIVLNLFLFAESFIGLRLSDVVFRFFPPLKQQRDDRALQGLLLACLGIGVASGLLVCGGVVISAPWLAQALYGQPELAPLFAVYGGTFLVSAFSGVYQAILRIHNRFASVVVPQVIGSLTSLGILTAYLAATDAYRLDVVIAAFAIGVLVQTVPPLVRAWRLVQPALGGLDVKAAGRALARYRSELLRCLFHSNLSGYLQLTMSPGDIFLLGVFAPPTQVALYGLARQLAAPPAMLQVNVQAALTPEVTSLAAKGQWTSLERLVRRYMASAFALGGVLVGGTLLLGHLFTAWLARPEYVTALLVLPPLLLASWLLLIFLVFRPLAISLDLLRWHNLALAVSTVVLLVLVLAGGWNAWTMAGAQLAGALIIRPLFTIPAWLRLRSLAENSVVPVASPLTAGRSAE
jgi:O-antigen/teichoic acid export membrane protein